jgi:release factor glutamine methyltransferase
MLNKHADTWPYGRNFAVLPLIMNDPRTVRHRLTQAQAQLRAAGIDGAALDARLLIGHVLQLDRLQLMLQAERELTADEITHSDLLIQRRAAHEPVARIIGCREFWGLPFGLNEATLEPRPDSETLIEAMLNAIGTRHRGRASSPPPPVPRPPLQILDLGTGTGCLLLALLHELPDATGVGIDIAPRAVAQATANAERLGLAHRATFQQGNWLDGVTGPFDIIVSNPPYIARDEIPTLMPEVRAHDPLAALDGGPDGLEPYRLIIPQLARFLNPAGIVAFEVGHTQATAVAELLYHAGFAQITTHQDLGGVARCVLAKLNAP